MMTKKTFRRPIAWLIPLMFLFTACTATTRTLSPDATIHYDAGYDFTDKKIIVGALVKSLISKPPLSVEEDRPVIIVTGIANRTSEHISTSAISDDIRQRVLESGKARFISETQRENVMKEIEYQQGGHVAPEMRIRLARQAGARYILSGTLRSIEKKQPRQVRLKKRTLKYYSLNLELTDLETSLIEWTDSVEIVREASKPFIGW